MLVICPIAYMVIDQYFGIEVMKNASEGGSFFAVVLCKVAVEVEVL